MSAGDWAQAARGIGNLLVAAGMALTEEQELILFAAVHSVWPEAPAAPAAPAAEPVAHLRFRAAMHASPDGNVEAAEWLEVCEPTDIGDDQSPAFAVYDTPGATPAQSREPLTDERLTTFLNAAAGEGLVLDGVDAADLYIALFPERYRATIDSIAPGSQP